MKAIQRQYRSPFRLDPIGVGIVARVGHRENAIGIGAEQQVYIYLQRDSLGYRDTICAFCALWL